MIHEKYQSSKISYYCPFNFSFCRLGEDKPELIESVVTRFGRRLALTIYRQVQKTEASGGMVINVSYIHTYLRVLKGQ